MPPIVHDEASATRRLAELALTERDLVAAVRGADTETRKWTLLAPRIMPGMVRWGKTNELLRAGLQPRGWTYDSPKGLPRTISPARDFAIVATTGDSATGLPAASPATKYAKGVQTVLAVGRNVQLAFDFAGLDLQDALWPVAAEDDNLATWLLLYHVTDEQIRAELSLANGIDLRGHVSAWIERIILPVIDLLPQRDRRGTRPRVSRIMRTPTGVISRRGFQWIAAIAGLTAAAVGIFLAVRKPGVDQVVGPVHVTAARVTGFASSSLDGRTAGPVTTSLRAAPAAGLYRIAEGLRSSEGPRCMDEGELYQITFISGTSRMLVDGYSCQAWVTITTHGKRSGWTDGSCTLLHAVRRVLPAGALATRQDNACES